ncbi:hypothetical protein PR003_g25703 [Phytophthora rubi]|uniref:Reverse transcriptase/retrotransposon-derived protein RNase H-like domain-containing protein n=1 Tax=Phytophthora rubi TaxID=129364 RepID=A0A6A3I8Y6_9STRA|nr:hypothetical protein PR001_g24593 [Phytophthora rubi]KAE9288858.1 hypothetical protein PR003_g25703 [Phytophthora rubi]
MMTKDIGHKQLSRLSRSHALPHRDQPYHLAKTANEHQGASVATRVGRRLEDEVHAHGAPAIRPNQLPVSQKDLRKWLGLANYLPKYSANYAEMSRSLTNLLKKDAVWPWTSEAQHAFEAIKSSLQTVATAEPPEKVTTPSEGVTAPHPRYFHRIKVCLKPPRRLGQNRSGVTSRQSSLHSCV